MVSNEPKEEKKKESWEETNLANQETPNEQAELSEIETGNKGQPDFDEMISFNHTYLNYRFADVCQQKNN